MKIFFDRILKLIIIGNKENNFYKYIYIYNIIIYLLANINH